MCATHITYFFSLLLRPRACKASALKSQSVSLCVYQSQFCTESAISQYLSCTASNSFASMFSLSHSIKNCFFDIVVFKNVRQTLQALFFFLFERSRSFRASDTTQLQHLISSSMSCGRRQSNQFELDANRPNITLDIGRRLVFFSTRYL